jgi:hypothetical protein
MRTSQKLLTQAALATVSPALAYDGDSRVRPLELRSERVSVTYHWQ